MGSQCDQRRRQRSQHSSRARRASTKLAGGRESVDLDVMGQVVERSRPRTRSKFISTSAFCPQLERPSDRSHHSAQRWIRRRVSGHKFAVKVVDINVVYANGDPTRKLDSSNTRWGGNTATTPHSRSRWYSTTSKTDENYWRRRVSCDYETLKQLLSRISRKSGLLGVTITCSTKTYSPKNPARIQVERWRYRRLIR